MAFLTLHKDLTLVSSNQRVGGPGRDQHCVVKGERELLFPPSSSSWPSPALLSPPFISMRSRCLLAAAGLSRACLTLETGPCCGNEQR